MQRTVGNAATCHLLHAMRSAPERSVQRKVRYDDVNYDETTMPMAKLERLIRRVDREGKVGGAERGELLRVLLKRYEERGKTELVVVPKEGLPAATTKTSSPAPERPPDTPSTSVPKVITAALTPAAKPAPFDTSPITDANRSEVVKTLEDWWDYANAAEARLSVELGELRSQRSDQGDAYYEQSNAAERARYKELNAKVAHLSGSKNEAGSLRKTIADGTIELLDELLVLTRSGRIVAVAEWVGTYIANIVADPRNIVPEEGQERSGGGVARAVIGISVLKARRAAAKGEEERVTLYALNNKVKGIYAHLGFKVFVDEKYPLARPGQGVKIRSTTGLLEPYKTEWHVENNMVLPQEEALRFLGGLTEVVNPPGKLMKYL